MTDTMRTATLDGISGLGEVKVVRSGDGTILEIAGTWRPPDGSEATIANLHEARRKDRSVVYLGPIDDPAATDVTSGEVVARISSIQTYTYDDGVDRTLVRFNCIDELIYRTL